jgi:tetratricopeptide (TPR) repeat protein
MKTTTKIKFPIKLIFSVILICLLSSIAYASNFNPDASNLYNQGINAMRMRRLTPAQNAFKKLIEKYPETMHASLSRIQLARIYRDLNEHEKAISLLKEIIETDKSKGNKSVARESLLEILSELQRFREGIELLEVWQKTIDDRIWAKRQLAKFYLQSGKKDEAWLLLESIIEKSAEPDVFKDLLELAVKTGEVEKLLNTLENRRARYSNEDFADFASDCYIAMNQSQKAVETLKAAPGLKNHMLLLRKLADIEMNRKNYSEAIKALVAIQRLVPHNWDTLKKHGKCLFELNKPQEALKIWRKPMNTPYMRNREYFQNYTSVLIAHKMYQEALDGFREARRALRHRTLFAEEMASVLEAMGKKKEALEEYLRVFSNGYFKIEVFDKLYSSQNEDFNLKKELQKLISVVHQMPLKRALIELYFRDQKIDSVSEILALIDESVGMLDEMIVVRMKQDALVAPNEFHYQLASQLAKSKSPSSLSLKLGALILDMPYKNKADARQSFALIREIAQEKHVPDAVLKARLLLKMARVSLEWFHDVQQAHSFVDLILQTNLIRASSELALMAALFKTELFIYQEDFKQADSLINQNKSMFNTFVQDQSFIGDLPKITDLKAQREYYRGFLEMHKGEFQTALNRFKDILEKFPETLWVNDSLRLALFITRGSAGSFEIMKNYLKAERKFAIGKQAEAIQIMQDLTKGTTASTTGLLTDVPAKLLLMQEKSEDPEKLLKNIELFERTSPGHWMLPDLMMLKWRLMRQTKKSDHQVVEHLHNFIERYPADIRCESLKRAISHIEKGKQAVKSGK